MVPKVQAQQLFIVCPANKSSRSHISLKFHLKNVEWLPNFGYVSVITPETRS